MAKQESSANYQCCCYDIEDEVGFNKVTLHIVFNWMLFSLFILFKHEESRRKNVLRRNDGVPSKGIPDMAEVGRQTTSGRRCKSALWQTPR